MKLAGPHSPPFVPQLRQTVLAINNNNKIGRHDLEIYMIQRNQFPECLLFDKTPECMSHFCANYFQQIASRHSIWALCWFCR